MPAEKELSIKDLCSLYRLADRQLKHSGPKMTRPDEKKLGEMLTLYKRDYFSDNFGDGGYLDQMAKFEDDKGESMADVVDSKYGTNLELTWTSKDTKAAQQLGKIIASDHRSEMEGGDDKVELSQWHAFMAFEARHRIIAERSAITNKSKTKQNGESFVLQYICPCISLISFNAEPARAESADGGSKDTSNASQLSAREALGGKAMGPAKTSADELGHRVLSTGITAEDLEAFLKANPERALELAKLATDFQGAAEKISAKPGVRNPPSAPTTFKRPRAAVNDIVDLESDITEYAEPAHKRAKTRKEGGRRTSGRRVDRSTNIFADTFPLERVTSKEDGLPFGTALVVAAVMLDGPVQREDKEHKMRHKWVVKSAICNAFGADVVTEFEAIELDPETSNQETEALINEFCIARVESSRVMMLATLSRVKTWININIVGPGGPHPCAACNWHVITCNDM